MTNKVFHNFGSKYTPGTDEHTRAKLPPGVYEIIPPSMMSPLVFNQTRPCFEFPFKLYNLRTDVINRVMTAWKNTTTNLGIVLQGLRGTGKSVTMQELANAAIDMGMPVLIIREPLENLASYLEHLDQDVAVTFDEFEKTFAKPEEQQALLTLIDGVDRSQYRRLWLFSVNYAKIDENFIDRPSRIRYTINFGNLEATTISEILEDLLIPSLEHMKDQIFMYLMTRKIRTIDIVKAAIQDLNIFQDSPEELQKYMSLSTQPPEFYQIHIKDLNNEIFDSLQIKVRDSDGVQLMKLATPGMNTKVDPDWYCYSQGLSDILYMRYKGMTPQGPAFEIRLSNRSSFGWLKDASYQAKSLLEYINLDTSTFDTALPTEYKRLLKRTAFTQAQEEQLEELQSYTGKNNGFKAVICSIEPVFEQWVPKVHAIVKAEAM